jgi:hypothetical protein
MVLPSPNIHLLPIDSVKYGVTLPTMKSKLTLEIDFFQEKIQENQEKESNSPLSPTVPSFTNNITGSINGNRRSSSPSGRVART